MSRTDPLMEQAGRWADGGLALALATVVETWGSSPCPAGSQMVINEKAGFAGSVSGGCIETSVVSESLEIAADGGHEVLEYGVSDAMSFEAGLTCGGTVEVLAEKLDDDLFAALTGPRPLVRVVDLESGAWSVLQNGSVSGALDLPEAVAAAAAEALATEKARSLDAGGRRYFLHPVLPAYRMIIVGAVRIAQSLAPMAVEAGFEVFVVDPRRAFSTNERFPEINLVREWPQKALPELGVDAHTAVVTLTHDAKPDDSALGLALESEAFYVGALGSRRTHAKRVRRLQEAGYAETVIGRIRAPIGLDLGARTPAEIAVAILAQVIAAKNDKQRIAGLP